MTSLLFGQLTLTVPETEVRSTLVPKVDRSPAELPNPPGFNEHTTDAQPKEGLAPRALGANVTEGKPTNAWQAGLAQIDYGVRVDSQIASSGSAANRELTNYGHGNRDIEQSIEPVIRSGGDYGADYFAANQLGANSNSLTGINPVEQYFLALNGSGNVQATANDNSRKAAQQSILDTWLNG
jgi:hypothetical protein